MTDEIQIKHAIDVDPLSLIWPPDDDLYKGDRFMELAIRGNRVIGWWTYSVGRKRGRTIIDSVSTNIQQRFRRKGIARKLWLSGISYWAPDRITSTIGSWQGCSFLASMQVLLAVEHPEIFLSISFSDYFESYHCELAHAALARVKQQAFESQPKLKTVPLKQLKP